MTCAPTCRNGYKDASPDVTVARVREILSRLGITVKETFFSHGDVAYSCRLTISNPELAALNIGTNGKGITPAYALASGYAELMERLQNKFLINEAMRFAGLRAGGEPLPFRFFPDERVEETSMREYCNEILPAIFPRSVSGMPCTESPETRVRWRSVDYAMLTLADCCEVKGLPAIPLRANSSTGMCAGNSPAEAIVQGVCEVFERYVLQMIYCSDITPPSFPDGFFDGTEAAGRLASLEDDGYAWDVKDMSLGRGLPVVGLVLTNRANGTTMFRLGSDLNPDIALERCLTETFQGRVSSQDRFVDYSQPAVATAETVRAEYRRSLKDGNGRYPSSLFGTEPTYRWAYPAIRRSGDSLADLRGVISLIDSMGLRLYVRDNSFMGFCAYHVHIPGLSDHDPALMDVMGDYMRQLIPDDEGYLLETDSVWPLYDIGSCGDYSALAEFVGHTYPADTMVRLAPYNVSPRNVWNKHLLVSLLAVRGGDFRCASDAYRGFLAERAEAGLSVGGYLGCVGAYLAGKASGHAHERIRHDLAERFDTATVDEVMADMSDHTRVMDNYRLPTCFRCDVCPLQDDCRYDEVVALERRMQQLQIANMIDQTHLFSLLK